MVNKRFLLTEKWGGRDSMIPFVLIDTASDKGFYIDIFALRHCHQADFSSGKTGLSCLHSAAPSKRAFFLPAQKCEFLGSKEFSCPLDIEGVLAALYGPNWRIPASSSAEVVSTTVDEHEAPSWRVIVAGREQHVSHQTSNSQVGGVSMAVDEAGTPSQTSESSSGARMWPARQQAVPVIAGRVIVAGGDEHQHTNKQE